MAGILDFLFGSGPLRQAAQTGAPAQPAATPAQPANINIAGMAQQEADKQAALKKKKRQQMQQSVGDSVQKALMSTPDPTPQASAPMPAPQLLPPLQ